MNVFFDTNVLMDVFQKREPFALAAQRLWFLSERGRIRGLVSVLSFPNVYYVVRKLDGRDSALQMLRAMRDTFHVVPCDELILSQAMDAKLPDFEDAVQYFSALRADAACLVTRDPRHFPKPSLPVFSPQEFLSVHPFD